MSQKKVCSCGKIYRLENAVWRGLCYSCVVKKRHEHKASLPKPPRKVSEHIKAQRAELEYLKTQTEEQRQRAERQLAWLIHNKPSDMSLEHYWKKELAKLSRRAEYNRPRKKAYNQLTDRELMELRTKGLPNYIPLNTREAIFKERLARVKAGESVFKILQEIKDPTMPDF